jgi:putative oxidoreductase
MNPAVLLIARILMAVIFIVGGFGKLVGAAGFAGYLGSLGVPGGIAAAYLIGLFELACGLLVLAGFKTFYAALALAAFCIATAFIGHMGDMSAIVKNFALAGGYVFLAAYGPGAFALDRGARVSRYS